MDTVISQLDSSYLAQLIHYQKVVGQRNALLKYFALNHTFDADTLSIYNEQLIRLGQPLFEKRQSFVAEFTPIFQKHHQQITGHAEQVQLSYESDLFATSFSEHLNKSINRDKQLQYTTTGIHKDDLGFLIDGYPIKKFGSQGQQKSFLIALKLAQFEFVKKQSGEKPILLLDDIFDKLDESRVAQLVAMVNQEEFGQLFISDTHPDRTEAIVKNTHQTYQFFHL